MLRLRELRQARNISQEEFAEQADLSVASISRIETGKQNFSRDQLVLFANILKVAPVDLFEPNLSAEEEQMLLLTRRLPEPLRRQMLGYGEALAAAADPAREGSPSGDI